jgi:formamidopyrimidine-DNA glycosylase
MPELPEVEALARSLGESAAGAVIQRVELAAVSALKTAVPPLDALVGRTVAGTGRRGKFLLVDTDGLFLVLHLARAGWVRWKEALPPAPARPGKGPLALRVRLEGGAGFDVTEAGTEKRLAAYVVTAPEDVEGIARLGPDPLSPSFDAACLASLLAGRNTQLKGALTDQSLIAGVGNAYSDEALHAARLSPFKPVSRLTPEEVERLHSALVGVLSEALHRAAGVASSGLKAEKRSGMRVHGRTGQPCPVCGDTIREVSFATTSLQYCPTCQTGGKPLADRRLSRLLK